MSHGTHSGERLDCRVKVELHIQEVEYPPPTSTDWEGLR